MIDFCDLAGTRSLMKMCKLLLILSRWSERNVLDAEWGENMLLKVVFEI